MKPRLLISTIVSLIVLVAFSKQGAEEFEDENDVVYCRRNNDETAPSMTPPQSEENELMKSRTFTEDRKIVFPVAFTYGCPVPNLGQWFKDGQPIDPASDPRFAVELPSFRLTLNRARINDSGQYRFVVRNLVGSLEVAFNIFVTTGAPYWCPSPEGAPVASTDDCNCLPYDFTVGSSLVLDCNICANETALVNWFTGRYGDGRDLVPVKENPDARMSLLEKDNSSTLSMHFLVPQDDGILYECRASNRFGTFSFRWLLRQIHNDRPLNPKPPLLLPVANTTAKLGSAAKISCNLALTGDEILAETIWLRGDYAKLMTALNFTTENKSRNSFNLIPQLVAQHPDLRENTSSDVFHLSFNPVADKDYGPHTCYFTNSVGAAAKVVWLLKPPVEPSSDLIPVAVGVAMGAVALVTVLAVITVIYCRRRSIAFKPVKKRIIVMTNSEFYNMDQIRDHDIRIEIASHRPNLAVTSSVARSRYIMELDPRWEIPRSKVVLGESLGGGNIGYVVAAKLLDHYGERSRDVAVKMLRDDATDDDMLQLVKELMLLKQVGAHPNVVNFFGCCTQSGPILVVVELARYGNLRDFLRRHRPPEPETDYCLPSPSKAVSLSDHWSNGDGSTCSIDEAQLMSDSGLTLTYRHLVEFAQQIAKGMAYLSSKGCIHRDLAARNVLVADNYQLKVSDFGLTRRVDNISTDYYRRGNAAARLPLKWTAPESLLDSKYTTKSDVWSYGILLWEIYSLGENPYRDLAGYDEIYEFVVEQGRRLDRPKYADRNLFERVFKPCWNFNPDERPSFDDIRVILEDCGQFAPNVPLGSIPNFSLPTTPNELNLFLTPNGQQPLVRYSSANKQPQQDRLPSISEPPVDVVELDDSGQESSACSVDDKPPQSPGVATTSDDSQYSSIGNNATGNFSFNGNCNDNNSSQSSPQHHQGLLLSLPRRHDHHQPKQAAAKQRLSSTSSDSSPVHVDC